MSRGSRSSVNEYGFGIFVKMGLLVVGLLETILVARFLGPSLRGSLAVALSVIGVGSIVLSFGLFDAYAFFRRIFLTSSDREHSYRDVFMAQVVVLYFFLASIGALFWILGVLFVPNIVEWVLYFLYSILWAYSLIVGYVCLVERPNLRNAVFLLAGLIQSATAVFLWLFVDRNYWLWFGVLIAIEASKAIYFTFFGGFHINLGLYSFVHLRELLSFGVFPMVAVLLTTLNYRVDVLMLGAAASVSSVSLGVYAIGVGIAEKSMAVADSMREVLTSRLSRGHGAEEVARVTRVCFWLTAIVVVVLSVLGRPFIRLLFGGEYAGAYEITVLTLLGTIWMVFFKMISQYNVVEGRQKVNVALLMLSVVLNVALNLALIPRLGIVGSACATAVSYLLCATMFVAYFARHTGMSAWCLVGVKRDDIRRLGD